MCILAFSSFSAEISELKDEKAKMHNVHRDPSWVPPPEFFPAGWNCFLTGWSFCLAGWNLFLLFSSWLAGVSSWLASSWLAEVVRC